MSQQQPCIHQTDKFSPKRWEKDGAQGPRHPGTLVARYGVCVLSGSKPKGNQALWGLPDHTIIWGAPPEGCPPLSPRARGFAFTALSLKNMLLARKPVVKREALSLIFNLPGLNDRNRMSLGAPTQPHWTFHVSKSEESSARAPKPFLHDSRRFHLLF